MTKEVEVSGRRTNEGKHVILNRTVMFNICLLYNSSNERGIECGKLHSLQEAEYSIHVDENGTSHCQFSLPNAATNSMNEDNFIHLKGVHGVVLSMNYKDHSRGNFI